jgi:hypothetical protein
MPKTRKELVMRQAGMAYRNLNNAIGHLLNLEELFEAQHPEYSEPLQMCIVAITEIQNVMNNFALTVWGRVPNWDSVANLPKITTDTYAKNLQLPEPSEILDDEQE